MKKAVTFRVEEDTWERFEGVAEREGTSLTALLQVVLQQGMDRLESGKAMLPVTAIRVKDGATIYVVGSHEVTKEDKG